ncbi:MAG TPA: hypothetical protein VNA25_12670 [Phycisphaerae bacterium]|nr:hypothetical protein [Phycisphaerae bacterium]
MRTKLIAIALLIVACLAIACDSFDTEAQKNRESAVDQRNSVFAHARALVPEPTLSNFPTRRALVEFTERQDMIDHPWYVYILSDFGNVIGYYVAKTRPVNSCDFLSSTEDIQKTDKGTVVVTAPSLDGVYYGGAGASSGCDEWFFFDSATNALIEIRGVKFFTADQPLRLEADPIQVAPVQ